MTFLCHTCKVRSEEAASKDKLQEISPFMLSIASSQKRFLEVLASVVLYFFRQYIPSLSSNFSSTTRPDKKLCSC